MIRVVLDTNVLVSALLFEGGRLAWIRQSWQSGRVKPVLAEPTARELLRVLAYPKFQLTPAEIEQLLAELLPWSETWRQGSAPSSGVTQEVLCPSPEGEQGQSGNDCLKADRSAPLIHYEP